MPDGLGYSACDVPPAADQGLWLRRSSRSRALPQGARHHTLICVAGDEGFARLSAALKEHGLGLILDFVPNHMGVGSADNAWWLDVLEWGSGSPHARSFDIDWNALPHRRHPGVLLPILGSPWRGV